MLAGTRSCAVVPPYQLPAVTLDSVVQIERGLVRDLSVRVIRILGYLNGDHGFMERSDLKHLCCTADTTEATRFHRTSLNWKSLLSTFG